MNWACQDNSFWLHTFELDAYHHVETEKNFLYLQPNREQKTHTRYSLKRRKKNFSVILNTVKSPYFKKAEDPS